MADVSPETAQRLLDMELPENDADGAPEMTACPEPHPLDHRCFDCATDEELAASVPPYLAPVSGSPRSTTCEGAMAVTVNGGPVPQTSGNAVAVSPGLAAAMAETRELLEQRAGRGALLAEILGTYAPTGSGHASKVGQVRVARWKRDAGMELTERERMMARCLTGAGVSAARVTSFAILPFIG